MILRKAKTAYEFSGSKVKINHLLFMDDLKLYSLSKKELVSLVHTIHIFSKDIGLEFGMENCAVLAIEKGKIVKSVTIELPDAKVIMSLQESESYNYLGIIQVERFLGEYMKLKVSREYFRTVCSYHVTYAFQSESTLHSCLNVKKLLARNRRDI